MKSRHAIARLKGDFSDPDKIKGLLLQAAWNAQLNIISNIDHKFQPFGYTLIILLAESHFSIHTFPENDEAFVDCFTCGEKDPKAAIEELAKLGAYKIKGLRIVKR